MFVLIIQCKHITKNLHTIFILHVLSKNNSESNFAIKAFLHKYNKFYTLYTFCIYKSVSLSGLCPHVFESHKTNLFSQLN